MSRVALVVGASSGVGLATAETLRDAGYTVHAAARRDIPLDGVSAHPLDFTDRAAVDALAADFGTLDVLVIAAGANIKERRLHQLTGESWDFMLGANLTGPFNVLHAFLPALREARGQLVVISSVSGRYSDRSGPAYHAAKAGAIALTHGAAFELNGEVRCTAILPGVIDTPILENRPEPPPPEMRAQMLKAEDIAATVLFAVSLPPHAYVPEITILPTALQAIGKTQ
jgi:NADP-dependent 3-hydroxy acid dehydrogenase YdfG